MTGTAKSWPCQRPVAPRATGFIVAGALAKMVQISQGRAEDAEIVRRAELMAQEMLKQLQATPARPRRRP